MHEMHLLFVLLKKERKNVLKFFFDLVFPDDLLFFSECCKCCFKLKQRKKQNVLELLEKKTSRADLEKKALKLVNAQTKK